MQLTKGEVFHIYNRGNNKQRIFFSPENYHYFLRGVDNYLKPHCDILAWCLMPNHFHFLIHANEASIVEINDGSFKRQKFSQGIKQLLSSYTKAINKRHGRTGSLFQQKTKGKRVTEYAEVAFSYIHQNPLKSGLVSKIEEWEFSSFRDYAGLRNGGLCNYELVFSLLNFEEDKLYEALSSETDERLNYIL